MGFFCFDCFYVRFVGCVCYIRDVVCWLVFVDFSEVGRK